MAEKKLGFFGKIAQFFKKIPLRFKKFGQSVKDLPRTFKEGFPTKKYFKYNWQIYLLFLPTLIWVIMFVFVPFVTNVIMSFQDYNLDAGIFGSTFVGIDNYTKFFKTSGEFWKLLSNTLLLNVLVLVIGFPASIILAICIYESKSGFIKGLTQTATFLPFFISAVVVCNLAIEFLKADTGLITNILETITGKDYESSLLDDPKKFRMIYAIMELWQTMGYNSLIYLAALSAIDTSLYEASSIDGAGKFKQIWHVTLPGIAPTIIITLIMRVGRLLSMGYEKVLLLQTLNNDEVSEIISTYVYNFGLASRDYGYAATIGLFDAVVAIVLVSVVNKIAKKVSDTSLW